MPAKTRPGSKPPGGKPKSQAEVMRLTDQCEELMLTATRGERIAALLNLPPRTVGDYMRRVRERWEEDSRQDRSIRRSRQATRLYRYIITCKSQGLYKEVAEFERQLLKVEGNEMPKQIEVSGRNGAAIETSNITRVVLKLPDNGMRPSPPIESPTPAMLAAVESATSDGDGDSDDSAGSPSGDDD